MKHDVIILGGGPNGLAAALSLGSEKLPCPLQVLLLDSRDPTLVPEDNRGTALTQATQLMFRALELEDDLAPHLMEMRDIIVTDGNGTHDQRRSLLNFTTDSQHAAAAAMVENKHLSNALLKAVQRSPSITLQGGFSFTHFEVTSSRVLVHANTATYSAPLLVAADGRNSMVRTQLQIPLTTHDYQQTALSFAIAHELPHLQKAEEHFSAEGVFAFLPLPNNRASIVWGMTAKRAAELMALDEEAFNASLQNQMGQRVGVVKLSGKRAAYPLVMQIANQLIGPRIALLGDAAHAIHPLAGLGLNLGFKDAAALADCVMPALARGDDIGGPQVLEQYQTQRRFDTMATSLAMDGMNALFSNADPALKAMRGVGLRLVDHIPMLKAHFIAQAAGLSSDNPRLLQGQLPG